MEEEGGVVEEEEVVEVDMKSKVDFENRSKQNQNDAYFISKIKFSLFNNLPIVLIHEATLYYDCNHVSIHLISVVMNKNRWLMKFEVSHDC
jgi:hypothetical protein